MTIPRVKFQGNPQFPVNTVQIMRGAVVAGMDRLPPQYVAVMFFGKDRLRDVEEEIMRRKPA